MECKLRRFWVMVQSDLSDLAGEKEPLISAAFGALISADQRNDVSGNQRFLLPGKTN